MTTRAQGPGHKSAKAGNRARHRARRCVTQALYQWQLTGHDAESIDPQYLIDEDETEVDREYFDELLREIIARIDDIDALLGPLLDRPLREVDPVERAILRLGACELRYHPEIPFRVIINEAIELAKVFGAQHGHRYVNGILDKLSEQIRAEEVAIVQRGRT